MNIMILILAALLPAILLFLYICKQDPQPEPKSWLTKALLYGVGISVPIVIVELAIEYAIFGGEISTLFDTTIRAFFVAALPEEGFKLLALWLVLRKNPYFDEHFDGIVYAVCVSLGFAAVENITYVVSEEENWMAVAILRSLLAVPGHYAFAVLMGYYYSLYHFVDHSRRTAVCILLVPVLAHGIYDAFALSGTVDPSIGGVGAMALIYFCIKMHKFARTKMLAQIERDKNAKYTA